MVQGLKIVRQKAPAKVQACGGRQRREEEAMKVETLVGGLRAMYSGMQNSMRDMESLEEAGMTHVSVNLLREMVAPEQAVAPGIELREGIGTEM